jgi:glycosyltransferase involved in cell wall biosynthesis
LIKSIATCKLLYLVGQLGLGGLERQLSYLLRILDKARYCPQLVVWNYSEEDAYVNEIKLLDIPIHFFPSGISRYEKLRALCHLTQRLNPEVIHSYSFFTNFAAYWAARGTSAVALGSLRGEFSRTKKESGLLIGSLSARWPQHQISNNCSSAERAQRSTRLFGLTRIHVVRNGLDVQRFYNCNASANNKSSIAAIGSLLSVKRWDRLLRIILRVKKSGIGCQLRIAGDGPLRRALEELAQELGISESVHFMGVTLDVPKLLNTCRFLAHTSESEGQPNAVMEASACGRPVVAMDVGDIRALIDDGKTGFVVPQGDEITFSERVLQLLCDDELCNRMGMAAREKAEREFGLERLVSETLAAYKAAGWKDANV